MYDLLRERILTQRFVPGQRLDLQELEQQLQVSRTPLKDALSRLELEGLVEIHPRRGTFVAALNPQKFEEAYKIRSAYELYVALCLFKYLTQDDHHFLRQVGEQMNALAEVGDWQTVAGEYVQLDQQLHERFVLRGGPPRMLRLYEQTHVHLYLRLAQPYFSDRDFEATHFEHEQILEALASQSPDRLNAALLNHLESERVRAARALLRGLEAAS
ncbi:MAG: GntR family transcriptional regulator [Anaerolineae bacterium]|nr:GntR family transcriptional regulator [Anaerolineae bacterium]